MSLSLMEVFALFTRRILRLCRTRSFMGRLKDHISIYMKAYYLLYYMYVSCVDHVILARNHPKFSQSTCNPIQKSISQTFAGTQPVSNTKKSCSQASTTRLCRSGNILVTNVTAKLHFLPANSKNLPTTNQREKDKFPKINFIIYNVFKTKVIVS